MKRLDRRTFLRVSAGGAAALILAACGRPAGVSESPSRSVPSSPPTPDAASGGMGSNAVAPTPALPDGIPTEVRITPNDAFYEVDIGRGQPKIDPDTYRLRITGLVERELELSLDELRQRSAGAHMRTMECISNPVGGNLIGNAVWDVVPLRELLEEAGIKPGAVEIITRAADGFHTSVPIETALDPLAYLALSMNGEPLPREHGFPVRCLWPGRYGMKQPKWLVEIEVTDRPYTGYWEQQGWSNDAFIKVNSQIELPGDQARFSVGEQVLISGRAFAGRSGVQRVEVSTDNGETWHDANLVQAPEYPELVWTIWWYVWDTRDVSPGRYVLKARATDGEGNTQKGTRSGLFGDTFPDGTSLIHARAIFLDEV